MCPGCHSSLGTAGGRPTSITSGSSGSVEDERPDHLRGDRELHVGRQALGAGQEVDGHAPLGAPRVYGAEQPRPVAELGCVRDVQPAGERRPPARCSRGSVARDRDVVRDADVGRHRRGPGRARRFPSSVCHSHVTHGSGRTRRTGSVPPRTYHSIGLGSRSSKL